MGNSNREMDILRSIKGYIDPLIVTSLYMEVLERPSGSNLQRKMRRMGVGVGSTCQFRRRIGSPRVRGHHSLGAHGSGGGRQGIRGCQPANHSSLRRGSHGGVTWS